MPMLCTYTGSDVGEARSYMTPLMPQVVVAPYPYCLHCKVRQAHPEGDNWYKASSCCL